MKRRSDLMGISARKERERLKKHALIIIMARLQLLLPMEAAMKLPCQAQGWRVATKIAPSHIAGAGNGRFVTEDVIADNVVAIKPIQAISRVEALHTVAMDTALAFSSTTMVVGDEARRSGEAARLPVVPNTLQVTHARESASMQCKP